MRMVCQPELRERGSVGESSDWHGRLALPGVRSDRTVRGLDESLVRRD